MGDCEIFLERFFTNKTPIERYHIEQFRTCILDNLLNILQRKLRFFALFTGTLADLIEAHKTPVKYGTQAPMPMLYA